MAYFDKDFRRHVLDLEVGETKGNTGAGWFTGTCQIEREEADLYIVSMNFIEGTKTWRLNRRQMEKVLSYDYTYNDVFSTLEYGLSFLWEEKIEN